MKDVQSAGEEAWPSGVEVETPWFYVVPSFPSSSPGPTEEGEESGWVWSWSTVRSEEVAGPVPGVICLSPQMEAFRPGRELEQKATWKTRLKVSIHYGFPIDISSLIPMG